MDAQALGPLVAEFMERLEQDYPDGSLGEVLLLAEIQMRDAEGHTSTIIRHVSTDGRAHVQIGLLSLALRSIQPL